MHDELPTVCSVRSLAFQRETTEGPPTLGMPRVGERARLRAADVLFGPRGPPHWECHGGDLGSAI